VFIGDLQGYTRLQLLADWNLAAPFAQVTSWVPSLAQSASAKVSRLEMSIKIIDSRFHREPCLAMDKLSLRLQAPSFSIREAECSLSDFGGIETFGRHWRRFWYGEIASGTSFKFGLARRRTD
jgi:hypothetical protein